MAILLTVVGVAFAATLVLGIINGKNGGDSDLSFLDDQ